MQSARGARLLSFSRDEAKRLVKLATPVFFAQMSQMLMGVVDTVMTGHYRTTDMAGVALASSIWVPVSLCGVGVMLTMTPLIAQRVGAGQREAAPHLLRQGLMLALAISVPLMALLFFLSTHVDWFGIEGPTAEVCAGFLRAITCGLPGLLCFVAARGLPEGHARTRPAMIIAFSGLLLINVPLNYVLIHGLLGLPALGGVGCGIASAGACWYMCAAIVFHTRTAASYRDLHPIYVPARPDAALMARILRIGLPSALALLFEVGCFAVVALLLAPLGTTVIAGHQTALNFSGVLFMLPLSLGITSTIRVGNSLGEGRPDMAARAAGTALCVGVCLASFSCVLTLLLRHHIAALYTIDPEVRNLAAELLLYAAAFQFVDAVQAICIGALRGYNDTRFIFVACFVCYWCFGLPTGFALARTNLLLPAMGAAGFWIGFAVSLTILAFALLRRLRTLQSMSPEEVRRFIER